MELPFEGRNTRSLLEVLSLSTVYSYSIMPSHRYFKWYISASESRLLFLRQKSQTVDTIKPITYLQFVVVVVAH